MSRTTRSSCALAALLAYVALGAPATLDACVGDTLIGSAGDDLIDGTECDDTIVGIGGDDTLIGEGGADAFVISSGYCTPAFCPIPPVPFSPTFGVSDLVDFEPGEDRIALDRATVRALGSAVGHGFSVASEFAVVDADDAVAGNAALIVFSLDSATVFYNENGAAPGLGNGGPFATVDGVDTLTPADFDIVDFTPSTTTSTPSSTTSSTTSTSTTAPPCTSTRCLLADVGAQACRGQRLPRGIQSLENRALKLTDALATKTGKARNRLVVRARKALGSLATKAERAQKAKPPKIDEACGRAIADAARRAASAL